MTNHLLIKIIFFFILFLNFNIFSERINAQDIPQNRKKLQKLANEHFNNEEFSKALPLLLILDSLTPDNFEIKYEIGACYLNTPYEKTKGIPYLEYALEKGGNLLPNVVFYDLGTLYHINYQFNEAENQFKRFLEITEKNNHLRLSASRMITICNNAKEIYSNPILTEIYNIGAPINSDNSETTPLISADEEIVFFTRSFSKTYGQLDIEFLKKIYCSVLKNKKWQEPFEINIENPIDGMQISLAGTSPDGELLFFSIGNETSSDIYFCRIIDGKCNNFNKMPDVINSSFWEGKVSITPDGNTLYFSSNRPGGFGGKDIYVVTKDENGNWVDLKNLGSSVNTEFDEDAPFIHPDNKTLYFSSNGHNTMGGYDVFTSVKQDTTNNWTEPTNLGYPINTTSDDIGFVISANGNNAYLSSAHDNQYGKHDIYKVVLHKTIPLTLIKGVIMGGDPPKPVKAKIKVIDHETKERLRYVYNPSPKNGKYLLIFPPNKNYDMIIEAEGYYPQLINIFVPNQTYFYELFQEIYLKQVKINEKDSVIGQEITITNTFYDIYKTKAADSLTSEEESNKVHKFDDLLKTVENIINSTDSIGLDALDSLAENNNILENKNNKKSSNKEYNDLLNLIENAIEKTDSISLLLLDANTIYNDITSSVYFFGVDNISNNLEKVIVDNDTIYTLPKLNTIKNKEQNKVEIKNERIFEFKTSSENSRKYVYINNIYFDSGKSIIDKKYSQILNSIVELLLINKNLGIELHGYTDPVGDDDVNLELSKTRAFNVMEFIVSKQVESNRIIMNGHGESGNDSKGKINEMQMLRRVELKIFEVKNPSQE
ncbi:MAG: PD40 domain-containing protein [Bacteroidia bacterium]|nr:PD40 domain-containing protein [Bacteroidia bacterium]